MDPQCAKYWDWATVEAISGRTEKAQGTVGKTNTVFASNKKFLYSFCDKRFLDTGRCKGWVKVIKLD